MSKSLDFLELTLGKNGGQVIGSFKYLSGDNQKWLAVILVAQSKRTYSL